MQQRRGFKQVKSFEERLAEQAKLCREEAARIPRGAARDLLLQRAEQAERAVHMNAWLTSPGLRAPV